MTVNNFVMPANECLSLQSKVRGSPPRQAFHLLRLFAILYFQKYRVPHSYFYTNVLVCSYRVLMPALSRQYCENVKNEYLPSCDIDDILYTIPNYYVCVRTVISTKKKKKKKKK